MIDDFKHAPRPEVARLLQSSLCFIAPKAIVDIHYHHCFQLCVSLNQPFDCLVGDTMLRNTWGFLANQTIPHSCNSPQTIKLIIFVDPDSRWGNTLKTWLQGAPFLETVSLMAPHHFLNVLPTDYATRTNDELHNYISDFLQQLFPLRSLQPLHNQDKRILTALQYVDQHLQEKLKLDDIADLICLSPERTRHLFVEEAGIPFSQYVLWKRIRQVTAAVTLHEAAATDACLHYGFTDYPHFSRIFRRMFGVSPKSVLRHCRVIL